MHSRYGQLQQLNVYSAALKRLNLSESQRERRAKGQRKRWASETAFSHLWWPLEYAVKYGNGTEEGRTRAVEGREYRQFFAPEIGWIYFSFRTYGYSTHIRK